MSEESWEDIEGYEGFYQVSNLGRVRSVDREVMRKGHVARLKGRILNIAINRDGYGLVLLTKNSERKRFSVHSIVAKTFITNPDPTNFIQVNHKNENKLDNTPNNLEWCTHSYNCNYGRRNKRISENNLNKKGKAIIAVSIKTGEEVHFPSIMEASRNGFNRACIWKALQGTFQQYRGYVWQYTTNKNGGETS